MLTGAGLVVAVLACQNAPKQLASTLSVASQAPPSSLLRLPAAGGTAKIYRDPALAEAEWLSLDKFPALRRPIGVDLDLGLVYALGAKNDVVALDLQTGRIPPTLLPGVREAALGPDGTLYMVDDSNKVTEVVRRNPVRFQTRLPGRPRDLFGTRDAQLIAVSAAAANTLTILSSENPPATLLLPRGDATATQWGDLIAVAAYTAVILVEPRTKTAPRSLRVSGHARAVVFSPSGHRLYIASRTGSVLVMNRFTDEIVGDLKLPGPAGALRSDPYGRWMLAHPPTADSVWVADLATGRYAGGFATEWGPDLPTVTDRQTLLVREGPDVLAFDLSRAGFPGTGRVAGGAKDLWVPLAWTPETGTSIPVAAGTEVAIPEDTGPETQVYLQVSSSQNPAWAGELANQLADAGLPASVLKPGSGEEGYRVVLGPYASRDEAEASGRKLGRPFFIYQTDRAPGR